MYVLSKELIDLFFLLVTFLFFVFLFLTVFVKKIYEQYIKDNRLDELLIKLQELQSQKENNQKQGGM